MRTRRFVMVAALLLVAADARAQQGTPAPEDQQGAPKSSTPVQTSLDTGFSSRIDFGFRGTRFDSGGDKARFQRYRDVRDGGFLDGFRLRKDTDQYLFSLQADRVGYRDQRYLASYNDYGRVKASFEWNQVPLFYSQDSSWLYTDTGSGTLRIANQAIRSGLENGTLRLQDVSRFLDSSFDLQQRRDIAALNVVASVSKEVDTKFYLTSTHKQGQMPWGASFGFSAANEIAAPLDHRTTDVGASVEWANKKGMARVGWDASWFNNSIQTLVYDSPYKTTDSTNPSAYVAGNGTSQGRTAMWPSSLANTGSVAAAYNLPGHSRINGMLSIGQLSQNEALVPFTINSAIAPIPLDRPTAEAEARITSMNVSFNSRPTNTLWFNVRARRYDYDNRTPLFHVANYVRLDQVIEPSSLGHNEPFGYTRDFVDADASFTPLPYTALKVGYGFEQDDRTFRFLEKTREHTLRTAFDLTGNQYALFRVAYEHAKRVGSGLDEEAFDEIGEQVSLRQYDISDRNRDRVTALVQVTPISEFAIVGSASVGRDSRPDTNFGLRKFDTNMYSIGVDLTPVNTVGLGLTYSYEDYATNQKSRQANPGPQFDDPTRDWFTDVTEKVQYVVASVDLTKAIPKTDVRVAYDWNRSHSGYVYTLAPNTTLAPIVPLPAVRNELQRASVDFKYFLTRHLAAGFVYWYENYSVDDFQMSPQYVIGNRTLADGIVLGYFFRPYRANTGWFRLTYLW